MKAPDKIYLPILPRIEDSIISEHCVGTAWDSKEHITIPDIEEYIRKDALLEWAKNMRRICKDVKPVEKAYQTMIDKIESLW